MPKHERCTSVVLEEDIQTEIAHIMDLAQQSSPIGQRPSQTTILRLILRAGTPIVRSQVESAMGAK